VTNHQTLKSQQSPSTVPDWVPRSRRRNRRPVGRAAIGPDEHTHTLKVPHPGMVPWWGRLLSL